PSQAALARYQSRSHLLGLFLVGVGALARRVIAALAEEAFTASDDGGYDYAVAHLEVTRFGPTSTTSPMVSRRRCRRSACQVSSQLTDAAPARRLCMRSL